MAAKAGKSKRGIVLAIVAVAGVAAYYISRAHAHEQVLTGIVTTDDVIVSPLMTGQLTQLTVKEGDVVKKGQLLAVLSPAEMQADRNFFAFSAKGFSGQIKESEAALRLQERQTAQSIKQAEAQLAAVTAQQAEARATLENASANLKRIDQLTARNSSTPQEADSARTAVAVAKARVDSADKQVEAQKAMVALARASAEQVAVRQSALDATRQQQAAAEAQTAKAEVRLGYTEVHAPIDGVVDVRAARIGEVVAAGQPILTLVNPDELWVRVDVEETYIDQVRVGDRLPVRWPSGEEVPGVVFYRGVDAGFATQRDASRQKRDIKTFEIRLRVDNRARRIAVGMTAYVTLPVGG
jgi:multidrug resistance efflux pump